MTASTGLLVLHAAGDEAGGRPWREAFLRAGWPGPVAAPDLPGHAGSPPPVGGQYELADPALHALSVLRGAGLEGPPVVVGVGTSGWPASVLALGGRAAGLVLVDGLGGPWRSPAAAIGAGVEWLRAVADDPAALAPAPAGGPDPRVRHGVLPHFDRGLAVRTARSLEVPVLVLESPASPVPAADRDELLGAMADGTSAAVEDASPEAVAGAAVAWWPASAPSRASQAWPA